MAARMRAHASTNTREHMRPPPPPCPLPSRPATHMAHASTFGELLGSLAPPLALAAAPGERGWVPLAVAGCVVVCGAAAAAAWAVGSSSSSKANAKAKAKASAKVGGGGACACVCACSTSSAGGQFFLCVCVCLQGHALGRTPSSGKSTWDTYQFGRSDSFCARALTVCVPSACARQVFF
jgi:hypothetical protein